MDETIADNPSQAEETSEAHEASEMSEASDASEASEVSEAIDASEASEVSEASESSEDREPTPGQAAVAADDPEVMSAEEPGVDGELDELFLSPDDDSEDVIEVDYDGEADPDNAGVEVREEDVSELHDEIEQLNERVEQAEKERGDFKERWMRAAADLENLRKRAKREREEQRKYGTDKLALELLPAVDNLERALMHAETSEDSGSIVDGVNMVHRQVLTALEKHGITGFEAKGEKFNPEQHEAIQQVETTELDTGTVVEQFQKGYFIHDRLLRPALVSVAKRVAGGDNEQQSEASEASESNDAGDDGPESTE